MMATAPILEQTVILYDSKRGKGIPYDTAYTDDQIRRAIVRCATRHGRMGTNVRSVTADNYPPRGT